MKLSEAIRLGSMLKPQTFDTYFGEGGSCALGAAMNACGFDAEYTDPSEQCPQLFKIATAHNWMLVEIQSHPCPVCTNRCEGNTIPHLNDVHKWTREQIADWVETIEKALDEQQVLTGATV